MRKDAKRGSRAASAAAFGGAKTAVSEGFLVPNGHVAALRYTVRDTKNFSCTRARAPSTVRIAYE